MREYIKEFKKGMAIPREIYHDLFKDMSGAFRFMGFFAILTSSVLVILTLILIIVGLL